MDSKPLTVCDLSTSSSHLGDFCRTGLSLREGLGEPLDGSFGDDWGDNLREDLGEDRGDPLARWGLHTVSKQYVKTSSLSTMKNKV